MASGLDGVVSVLGHRDFALDALGMAEALWLASRMPAATVSDTVVPPAAADVAPSPPGGPPLTAPLPATGAADPPAAAPAAPEPPPSAPAFAPFGSAGGDRATMVHRRAGRALPLAAEIGRALRPLRWRRAIGRRQELDAEATARAYAETTLLLPVFRPVPDRWFDLDLVVDVSPSMAVWRDTLRELTAVLDFAATFRSVRRWRLGPDGLRTAAGHRVPGRTLRARSDTRIVLLVSDCLGEPWQSAERWNLVREWIAAAPIALLNPLPSRLWHASALDIPLVRLTGRQRDGRFRFTVPSAAELWRRRHHDGTDQPGVWLPLPVVTLNPRSFARWAATTTRTGTQGCDGALVPPEGRLAGGPEPAAATSPQRLVHRFRMSAGPLATKLATLCAVVDTIPLSWVYIIRERLVADATATDLAELLVGGLATISGEPGDVVLRFRPGAAAALRSLQSSADSQSLYHAMTEGLRTATGSAWTTAMVRDLTGTTAIPSGAAPMAEIALATLRRLGVVPPAPEPAAAAAERGTEPPHPLAGLDEAIAGRDVEKLHYIAMWLRRNPKDALPAARRLAVALADLIRAGIDDEQLVVDVMDSLHLVVMDIANSGDENLPDLVGPLVGELMQRGRGGPFVAMLQRSVAIVHSKQHRYGTAEQWLHDAWRYAYRQLADRNGRWAHDVRSREALQQVGLQASGLFSRILEFRLADPAYASAEPGSSEQWSEMRQLAELAMRSAAFAYGELTDMAAAEPFPAVKIRRRAATTNWNVQTRCMHLRTLLLQATLDAAEAHRIGDATDRSQLERGTTQVIVDTVPPLFRETSHYPLSGAQQNELTRIAMHYSLLDRMAFLPPASSANGLPVHLRQPARLPGAADSPRFDIEAATSFLTARNNDAGILACVAHPVVRAAFSRRSRPDPGPASAASPYLRWLESTPPGNALRRLILRGEVLAWSQARQARRDMLATMGERFWR